MSDLLLRHCLQTISNLRESVGFSFVTLFSTNEGYNLYYRNEFEPIDDDMQIAINTGKEDLSIPMYLPLDIE